LENLEKMDRFLDTFDHPKLNQEDNSHQSRSTIVNKIEAVTKSLPCKKVQNLTDSLLNPTRHLREN
jgi:hypothetical protein